MRNKVASGSILFLFLISGLVIAQEKNASKKNQLQLERKQRLNRSDQLIMPRINSQVTLDGLSNEPAWEGIEPLPVVQHTPNFGNEPTELTEILLAYDDNYLYVAGRLYEREPLKIQSNFKKRDADDSSSDWFGITLDSFNDKENALAFFTTPSGLRWDSMILNDAKDSIPIKTSWNTFWDVVTARNNNGWFVEMCIPFSSLRFQEKNGRVVMGLIVRRKIARKNEQVIFPAIPPNWGFFSFFKPSQAQEVVFKGLHSCKSLYIAPYILGELGQSFNLNSAETAYQRIDNFKHELGLDVKYALTSNLTLDITLNTDFAQVEADDQQINLTRFSLFFPEKRLFFQERSSTFDFNFDETNRLFYSRRIGIHAGESVRIYGGARLVGRVGPWDLGFLNMQTASVEDLPSENFGVFRIRRQVFNPYSYVGSIVTTRIGVDGTYNTAYGLDGIFRLFRDDYLSLNWAQTFENDKGNNLVSLDHARIRVNLERRTLNGLGYNLDYSRSGAAYNPGIGFEMRDNYTRFGNRVLYGWIPDEHSPLLRHNVFLDGFIFLHNTDGATESAEIGPGWEFTTKSGYISNIALKLFREDVNESFEFSNEAEVPVGKYTFYGLKSKFETPRHKIFSAKATVNAGSFYDGRRVSIEISPVWRPSSTWELSGTYQLNRIVFPERDQKFTGQ